MKFVISSHINGYKLTYPKLIPSLIASGINLSDVFFVIGGCDHTHQLINNDNINIIHVTHNSMDFTGLISIIDLNIVSDYWFLLHDTCIVGPEFSNYLQSFTNDSPAISLSYDLSMNMGSYRWDYLQEIKSELLKFKNLDNSLSGLLTFKSRMVECEDIFLHSFRSTNHYCTSPRVILPYNNIYNTGIDRIIEYFPGIDLYKIKANWYNKEKYELNV